MEKAIDDQCSGSLVHLILDRFPANRNFDDDVHVLRGIIPDLDRVDPHGRLPDVSSNELGIIKHDRGTAVPERSRPRIVSSRSIGDLYLPCRKCDLAAWRRSLRDRWDIVRRDRGQQRHARPAWNRVHDLAWRQGPTMPQMIVHQIHRLDEIAMKWDVVRAVAGKLVQGVEVVRICDLVVVQRAGRSLDYLVETKIGTRGEIRRQDAVVASGYENRRNAPQLSGREHLFHSVGDA